MVPLGPGDAGLLGDVGVEGSEGGLLTRGLTGGDWNVLKNPLPGTSKQLELIFTIIVDMLVL